MNPSLLTPFRESRCPDWICPVCGGNTLAIKEGTFHAGQTAESSKIWVTPEFGLPDMEFVFVCLLFCERTRCPAVVAVTGTGVLPDSDRARPAAEDIQELIELEKFNPETLCSGADPADGHPTGQSAGCGRTHHPQVEIRRDQYGVRHLVLSVLAGRAGDAAGRTGLAGSDAFPDTSENESSLESPL